jgi:hypothetical protein
MSVVLSAGATWTSVGGATSVPSRRPTSWAPADGGQDLGASDWIIFSGQKLAEGGRD